MFVFASELLFGNLLQKIGYRKHETKRIIVQMTVPMQFRIVKLLVGKESAHRSTKFETAAAIHKEVSLHEEVGESRICDCMWSCGAVGLCTCVDFVWHHSSHEEEEAVHGSKNQECVPCVIILRSAATPMKKGMQCTRC